MSEVQIRWCCMPFKGHYAEAGEQSFSILVDRRESGTPIFILQFNALRHGDSLPVLDVPVCIEANVAVHHCPWCGRNLARWYRRVIDKLIRDEFRGRLRC